ncbi:MAG: hypothetical protein IJQ56_02320 [Synergistaceae bacterium]|nr:hypothetical protein [Synergistaceae bacterium]
MHIYDDNYLNRRAAFWDNWRCSLENAIRQFDADSAGKFVNPDDKIIISQVRDILGMAYVATLRRYHSVLGEQINAIAEVTQA